MKHFFVLAGLLCLPLQALAFVDVSAVHTSRRAIEYLQQEGVLQGYEDGLFRPAFSINRAEFLKVLVAAQGIDPPAEQFGRCFPDVVDQWYARYVCYAAVQGWVQGYPDGTFGPERSVSFAEAVKMLVGARGYPLAPTDEILRQGLDPDQWYAPFLATSLAIDIVSRDQMPLASPVSRASIAEMLYRSLLAEGAVRTVLRTADCTMLPTALEVKTYVDVLLPARTNIFRQELRAVDDAGASCLLADDANPFGRVTKSFDTAFLQPYPGGQPKDTWTVRLPLTQGRAVLRGATIDGVFRPEIFTADVFAGELRQLPSMFAAPGASDTSDDGRIVVYIGIAGQTLEAIDLTAGTHVVVDVAASPLTFVGSRKNDQTAILSLDADNVVTYTLYDPTIETENGGYLVLEVRTADIDAFLQPFPSLP